MKHTASYPHQRHQSLARLLLIIWLPTICSPEATCSSVSQSEQVVSAAASTNSGAPRLPKRDIAPSKSNVPRQPLGEPLQKMPPDSRPTSQATGQFLDEDKECEMEFYKKVGDLAWQQSEDYDRALKKQWDQLIILQRGDLAKLSADQLEALRLAIAYEIYSTNYHAAAQANDLLNETNLKANMVLGLWILGCFYVAKVYGPINTLRLKYYTMAHELYSASCHAAAQGHDLLNETNLKVTMAECLLRLGYPLEAKMYVLNMLFRVMSASSDIKVEALRRAQTLLAKVEEAQQACADEQTATSSPTDTLSTLQQLNECSEQSPTATQEGDVDPEIQIQWAVAQDLRAIVQKLLVSAYEPPRPPVSEATISSMQDLAKSFNHTAMEAKIVSALLLIVIDVPLSLGIIVEVYNLHKWTITNLDLVHLFLGSFLVLGLTEIAFFLNFVLILSWQNLVAEYAKPLWEEGARRKEKAEALKAYCQGNVQKCLGILFKTTISYLREDQINETLQQYNFRRDIIAWLFVTRGKKLLGDRITDSSPGGCQSEAKSLFQLAEKLAQGRDESVIKSPIEMDRKPREICCELANLVWKEFLWLFFGEIWRIRIIIEALRQWLRLTIAELEALEDVQERSSEESLATVRMIAKMNLALATLSMEKATLKELNQAIYEALKYYLQLQRNRPESQHPMSRLRLAAIRDLAGELVPAAPDQ